MEWRIPKSPDSIDGLDAIQQHICRYWTNPTWLFSVTQIAHRTGYGRGKVRRSIKALEQMGIARRWC